jgi:hypothetical protein
MLRGSYRACQVTAFAAGLAAATCSAPQRDPITYQGGTLVVVNKTNREWRNVHVVINDYFHGGAASLPPGGRMTAPMSEFQTGAGQKFDRVRMSIRKVVVTATAEGGKPIRLEWDGRQMIRNET